jgi:polyferredoxin
MKINIRKRKLREKQLVKKMKSIMIVGVVIVIIVVVPISSLLKAHSTTTAAREDVMELSGDEGPPVSHSF